ncbi:PBP1A family penicillin-binding protein [bacterium]|nr:PBP1A family penicillin-binding protein [bacterium]
MAFYIKRVLLYAAIWAILGAGTVAAVVAHFSDGLPSLEQLERVEPKRTTILYSADNRVVRKFAVQYREPIPFERLPRRAVDALIAREDRSFWGHWGVSLLDNVRAVIVDLIAMRRKQGASTITQQLARNLFLTLDVAWSRKIQEAMVAVLIERTYTKREILEMYFNQVYFGHGVYGLQSAAQRFFGKEARHLNLEECATLVALLKNPFRYSPIDYPERAAHWRNVVLKTMLDAGKITSREYEAVLQRPLTLKAAPEDGGEAPYFAEHVRQYLEATYGVNALYQEGLSVYTTLDSRLQRIAEEELIAKLDELQPRVAAGRTGAARRMSPGLTEADSMRMRVIQGALLAIDPSNGHILAMVGGRDFDKNRFNRATQALRQPGSAFKPFIYTAAVDNGYRTTDPLLDTALSVPQPDGTVWSPENYEHDYLGVVTLRQALTRSRNLATIRLLQALNPQTVVPYARKMGISTPIVPVLSMGLGTSEVKLVDLVAAYGVLPHQGVRAEPIAILKVVDKDGNVLEQRDKGAESEALKASTAGVMTSLLRSVVDDTAGGTGRNARLLFGFARPAGGKTGTTNDYTDAWFVGFTPQIVAGVWVGFDEKISLGNRQTGGQVALPVWARFMKRGHEALRLPVEDFEVPPDVTQIEVCGEHPGLIVSLYCPVRQREMFVKGTEPAEVCTFHTVHTVGRGGEQRRRSGLQF